MRTSFAFRLALQKSAPQAPARGEETDDHLDDEKEAVP